MKPILSRRTRVSSSSDKVLRFSPSIRISPVVGRSSPAMRFNNVDFPEPDGPMIETTSPLATSRSMSSSAVAFRFPSKIFETRVSKIIKRWLQPIQHEVNDHARYRDISPDGERPARESDVACKPAFESQERGPQNHWQHNSSKHGVRQQQREVHIPNPALFSEPNTSHVVVIKKIRSEKQSGNNQGSRHARLMRADILLFDEIKTRSDQDRGREVQCRIQCRQIGNADHKSAAASVNNFRMSSSSVPP